MNTQELTLNNVVECMQKAYTLTYTDYTTNLNNSMDIVLECLGKKSADPLFDFANEYEQGEQVQQIIEELKESLSEQGYTQEQIETLFSDNEDAIRDEIYSRDDSDIVGALVRNTRDIAIRVELHSNYDCINSHHFEGCYSYEESYFGAMVDALNLNPRKVQERFKEVGIQTEGIFPDKAERNGSEWVGYIYFATEIENSSSPANLLTFVATLSLIDLYDAGFDLKDITLPENNVCGIFSSTYGGGSAMEMPLMKRVTIRLNEKPYDYFSLCIDADRDYGYSIKETYGVTDEFFGRTARIIKSVA